ncbi:hypothetical protein [Botryobacter ruber]|uniref:hypothetical protein n=1 Tax=Botryobacter ruber TaxID=2171629 RepID=UPI000F647441|nr:hypothetical protein [Botryobacter ruber]
MNQEIIETKKLKMRGTNLAGIYKKHILSDLYLLIKYYSTFIPVVLQLLPIFLGEGGASACKQQQREWWLVQQLSGSKKRSLSSTRGR